MSPCRVATCPGTASSPWRTSWPRSWRLTRPPRRDRGHQRRAQGHAGGRSGPGGRERAAAVAQSRLNTARADPARRASASEARQGSLVGVAEDGRHFGRLDLVGPRHLGSVPGGLDGDGRRVAFQRHPLDHRVRDGSGGLVAREQSLTNLHAAHADDPVVALETEGLERREELAHDRRSPPPWPRPRRCEPPPSRQPRLLPSLPPRSFRMD